MGSCPVALEGEWSNCFQDHPTSRTEKAIVTKVSLYRQ